MFTGSSRAAQRRQVVRQAGRQASRELASARRGKERWGEDGRGRVERVDSVGGVNDPWIYYLMSSSGDENSTAG